MEANAQSKTVLDAAERIRRYDKLIQKQVGVAVKPLRFDGYVNLLNKYGTQRDTTENYRYESEPTIADEMLSSIYEGNGLFARIIDAPAEEAMKLGFELDGVKNDKLTEFYETALDDLDWEEIGITAIKWARLFGGSLAVMLINDGRGLEEPLDWRNIRSIDGIRVYDRSVIQPDYSRMFSYTPADPFRTRGNTIGVPETYEIYSKYGDFKVHESRCLIFRNGVLPENCSNSIYEMWGMPEYIRIKRAMRDCELAHGNGPKMLERAIQAVYKAKGLSELLQTDMGEDMVLKRLQTIDLARGLLNSIAIDSDGEEYDFKTFSFTGVSEIIDTTCNQLSALTSIPQTILFGRSPAGMNATGESDMENWYSFVARIQKRMLRRNLRYLLSIIFQAGITTGEVDEVPPIKPKFNPLWSLSELEEAQLEQTKAATQQTKATTAQIYASMQAVDPAEIRKGLANSGEFDIETLLDDYSDEELFPPEDEHQNPDDGILSSETTASERENIAEWGNFAECAEGGNTLDVAQPQNMSSKEHTEVRKDGLCAKRIDVDWITVNGAHVPLDDDGTVSSGGQTSLRGRKFERAISTSKTEKASGVASPASSRLKPVVKSPKDFDDYIAENGLTLMYRGLSAPSEETAREYAEQIRQGTAPVSGDKRSAIGRGVYFTERKTEAEGYIERRKIESGDISGRTVTAVLDVGANIADQDALNALYRQKDMEAAQLMEKAFEDDTPPEKGRWYGKQSDSLRSMDIASYAQIKGYDAIKTSDGEYVVMNQAALVVRNDSNCNATDVSVSVGVIVIENGRILVGTRNSDTDRNKLCGPGGHIEHGEAPEQAAIRETQEEFGITPKNLILIGKGPQEESGLSPYIYLTDEYEGLIECTDREIVYPHFESLKELYRQMPKLFQPFKDSLDILQEFVKTGEPINLEKISDFSENPIDKCYESGIVRVRGQQRTDDDADKMQFITVNGAHVPLVNGKAVGGPLKGEDFSEAKSEKKTPRKTGSEKATANKAAQPQKQREHKAQSEKSGSSKSGSSNKQNKRAASKPSPHSKNERTTGFINKVELEDHFGRHGKALGCSSKEEYQERGIDLLTKPCTNGIAGYARADGKVVRFNTKTGEYVSGYPGQNLCTYMIPKDNNGVDLPRALAYYNKHREADEKRYGTLK